MKRSSQARKTLHRARQTSKLSPVAAAPLTIDSWSDLSDDYIERQDLYLASGASTISLYKNPSKPELVEGAVAANGKYYTLTRDDIGGTWSLVEYVDPKNAPVGCTEVVSFVYPDGRVGVAASTPDYLYFFDITAEGPKCLEAWTQGALSRLRVAYTPALPQRIPTIYAVSPDGNLEIFWWNGREHEPLYVNIGGILSTSDFVLTTPSQTILMASVNGVLTWYVIGGPKLLGPFTAGGLQIKQVVMCYQTSAEGCDVLVLGPEDQNTHESQLYFVNGLGANNFNPQFNPIGDVTAIRAVGAIDANSLMHIYLVDSKNNLSVLHQTGWKTDPTLGWPALQPEFIAATRKSKDATKVEPTALPFTNGVADIIVDQYPTDHPVLAAFSASSAASPRGASATVRLIGRDAESLEWWNEPVRLASTQFYKVSRWQTRATLLDRNGTPVPSYFVSLHAETACIVDIGGESWALDPKLPPVEVQTDGSGQLVFSSLALGLTTPAITILGEGFPAAEEIRPDEQVQSYIAGTGSLPFKPTFNKETLTSATVNGKPLAPKLKPEDAGAFLEHMRTTIAFADPNMPQPKTVGLVFQTYDSSRPTHETFMIREDFEAARARLRASPRFGGFWDDLEDFANDVWEGIKTGAAAVVQVAQDTVSKAIELAIDIGGKLYALSEIAIETLTDAFHAVESFFNMVGTGAELFIDWLKNGFSFAEIWNTHKALYEGLKELGPSLAGDNGLVKKARAFFDDKLDGLKKQIEDTLDPKSATLTQAFGNVAMGDLKSGAPYAQRNSPPQGQQLKQTLNSTSAMWVLDRCRGPWLEPIGDILPSLQSIFESIQSPAQALYNKLSESEDTLKGLAQSLYDWTNAAVAAASDPAAAFENALMVGENSLIALARTVALAAVDILKSVFDLAFDAFAAVAGAIGNIVTYDFEIGAIMRAWRWFQEQAGLAEADLSFLTLGGLISLAVAAPVTVFYKLVFGEQPFPDGHLPKASSGIGAAAASGVKGIVVTNMIVATLNSVFNFLSDGVIAAEAIANTGGAPPANPIAWGLAGIQLVLSFLEAIFSWPGENGLPFSSIDLDTSAGKAAFSNWMIGNVGAVLLDGALLAFTWKSMRNPRSARLLDPIGLLLLCGLGWGNLGSAIAEAVTGGYDDKQRYATIGKPFSSMFAPLVSVLTKAALDLPPIAVLLAIGKFGGDIVATGSAFAKLSFLPPSSAEQALSAQFAIP
jgi:hypothetical protein